MATSGVPLDIPKVQIIHTIHKHKGVVTQICKELDIIPKTLYNHKDADPEIAQALVDARKTFDTNLLDMCENTLAFALTKKETRLTNSLSAAKYVLDRKGKDRGYTPTALEQSDVDSPILTPALDTIKQLYDKHDEQDKRIRELEAKLAAIESKPVESSSPPITSIPTVDFHSYPAIDVPFTISNSIEEVPSLPQDFPKLPLTE